MMTGSEAVDIAPELLAQAAEERQRLAELEARVIRKGMAEVERMLVRCVWKGHDFMDVHVDTGGHIEYVGWDEGHEPEWHRDPLDAPAETYDLRGVTYRDIQEVHCECR